MMNEIGENVKKLMLLGIGAVAATAEKSKEVVDELVKKGELTVEQGKTLNEELIQPFDPDLVICGERGLSNIKYVFVGSVSTYLIRNVRCDVLVVKQD